MFDDVDDSVFRARSKDNTHAPTAIRLYALEILLAMFLTVAGQERIAKYWASLKTSCVQLDRLGPPAYFVERLAAFAASAAMRMSILQAKKCHPHHLMNNCFGSRLTWKPVSTSRCADGDSLIFKCNSQQMLRMSAQE